MVETVLNPLTSAKREKNRYIVFETISKREFGVDEISGAIWRSLFSLVGELGASRTAFRVVDWDRNLQIGILKVERNGLNSVRAALAMIKEVEREPAVFCVKSVSGILKKARLAAGLKQQN